jgi:hypothetical protein
MKHSEKILKGTKLFQIWFDPDFSKTLQKDASYHDYTPEDFTTKEHNGFKKLHYVGEEGTIYFETPDISISKFDFKTGDFNEIVEKDAIYSFYLLEGKMEINGKEIEKDSFVKIEDCSKIEYKVETSAELFVIQSPKKVDYTRFIERYS